MERTLVLVKPDGVQRGLVGKIIGRLENKGFRLVALKLMSVSRKLAEEHYGEHVDKPFFGDLVRFITSSPIVAMAIEGENASRSCELPWDLQTRKTRPRGQYEVTLV